MKLSKLGGVLNECICIHLFIVNPFFFYVHLGDLFSPFFSPKTTNQSSVEEWEANNHELLKRVGANNPAAVRRRVLSNTRRHFRMEQDLLRLKGLTTTFGKQVNRLQGRAQEMVSGGQEAEIVSQGQEEAMGSQRQE
jgi:hypothetical protein